LFSLSACVKGLGLAHLRLTGQMRCSHLAVFVKLSAKNLTLFRGYFFIRDKKNRGKSTVFLFVKNRMIDPFLCVMLSFLNHYR